MNYIVLQTTTDSEELAKELAQEAISRRLAACVQIVPVESVYRWQGKLETASEFRCEMKTRADYVGGLRAMIRELHTYETPEVVEILVHELSDEYKSWLDDQLGES